MSTVPAAAGSAISVGAEERDDTAESSPEGRRAVPDLRVAVLAVVAWAGALLGFLVPVSLTVCVLVGGAAAVLWGRRRGKPVLAPTAWLLAGAAVACSAFLRAETNQRNPVADLAEQDAFVTVTLRITSDPVLRQGRHQPYVVARAQVREVTGRGAAHRARVPVLVIGGEEWASVELGAVVHAQGRLRVPDDASVAAVLSSSRTPGVAEEPAGLLEGAEAVRAGIRAAVAPAGGEAGSLIPALVVGDDQGMPADVVEEFRVTGLTHLLAVSGTNLTLVVGFLLVVARWAGVRARGLVVVGILGVAGFVLLARTEPSVVRAAAMGSVALVGMSSNGRQKGVRALGVAVLVLLLVDPWLALSLGFALSASATAGILLLAPPWRDALMGWTPRWLAEAVAVPSAAQLACTPLVAAISEQVSLVAVVANMLVAAAVGPATVLGLVGGLLMLVAEPAGLVCGRLAGACGWWIIAVAEQAARLPTAAVAWPSSPVPLAVLATVCLLAALAAPRLLRRRGWSLLVAAALVLVVVRPLPSPGWPPRGWVMVACDVGQGDGVVLRTGSRSAVLVDVGPDPVLVDRCLDRLEVEELAAVVLTHFHADHVAGLPGVLADRPVGEVLVTRVAVPAGGAEAVAAWTAEAGVPVRVPDFGEVGQAGALTWQVVGPAPGFATSGQPVAGEEGTAANNASVALLVAAGDVRILLTGDMEPEAQRAMARAVPHLRVDVLKVPHHGSRYQDPSFVSGLGARLAVVSAGRDNDYGHPAPETLALLERAGMLVRRTDESGDVAVVLRDGRLEVVTAR